MFFLLFEIIQISVLRWYTHHIVLRADIYASYSSTRLYLSRKVLENQPGMAAYNIGYEIYTLYGLYRVNVCHVFIQN